MPQPRSVPGSASDWLARAKGDLALARGPLTKDVIVWAEGALERGK